MTSASLTGAGARHPRTLFYPYVPRDVEQAKAANPDRTAITGATVYASEVFKALLKHGTYERLLLPAAKRPPGGDLRDSALFAQNADRIRFIAEHELSSCRDLEHLVLFTPGPNIHNLLRVRELCGGTAPIAGVIHSLNHTSQMRAVSEMLVSPLRESDAVICSSTTGRRALAAMIQTASRRLESAGMIGVTLPIQMPVIPLGIDTSEFVSARNGHRSHAPGFDENDCVLLYLGRFGDTTKADLFPLLLVFARLARRHPHVRLILAGDDAYHHMAGALRSFAAALGCAERIRIVPNPSYEEKKALYAEADLFVSPVDSLQETFGLTLVEAMAAGLPVVASDWSGYRDIVEAGGTGILVPTAIPHYRHGADHLRSSGSMNTLDLIAATTTVDMAALEEALSGLCVNKAARLGLGERARVRARAMFDWTVVVRRYEALWDELVLAARRTAHSSASTASNPEYYDYVEVFGHYATRILDAASRVRITEAGLSAADVPLLLERVAVPSSWFSGASLQAILDYCRNRPDASIGEIVAACSSPDEGEAQCMSAVCRLCKYGLLEASPDQAS